MVPEGKIKLLSLLNSDPWDLVPSTSGGSKLKHNSSIKSNFLCLLEESMLYLNIPVMVPKHSGDVS